jgi:hypothetical protein
MNDLMTQPEKIVSYTQIHDMNTMIQFYVNCFNYSPELFIGAGIFAVVVGLYVAFNFQKIKYQICIFKMYLHNKE